MDNVFSCMKRLPLCGGAFFDDYHPAMDEEQGEFGSFFLLVSIVIVTALYFWRNFTVASTWHNRTCETKQRAHPPSYHSTRTMMETMSSSFSTMEEDTSIEGSAALSRKQDFLSRVNTDDYGYRGSEMGYIDEWRPVEFPQLLSPLGHDRKDDEEEQEIYLDYAGSGLPMKSQLEQICRDNISNILANPHSTGPAAARTLLRVKQVKTRVLSLFQATPGRYASLKLPDSFCQKHGTAVSPMDRHAGYDVVFTSGATEGFKIIAERFPWMSSSSDCGCHSTAAAAMTRTTQQRQPRSILMYATNSHNSVVGMRQLAIRQGAIFYSCDMEQLEQMTAQDLKALEEKLLAEPRNNETQHAMAATRSECFRDSSINDENDQQMKRRHLLVFPSECNFGGDRPDAKSIIAVAQECGWYTMLDIAKAASTGPVNLRELNPDFAALSFYKLFGDPTGIGALLVKRSSISVLFENDERRIPQYQGGGSVSIMVPNQDYTVPKGDSPAGQLESLTSGSIHFRGICNLSRGFDTLERLGGMFKIHKHTICLAWELTSRLRQLRHGNGKAAVQIYGAWGKSTCMTDNNGPTVAFNVIRNDGSVVGYNEVSKLASLHRPPIQFRTGCFCNPGACQGALGLTDQQVIENFEKNGHVCGDHIDVVNGLPTGAVRVSFGKDSIWEDLDAVVTFVERTFVNHHNETCSESDFTCENPTKVPRSPSTTQVHISEVYLFPIKSCAAQRPRKWLLELPSGKLKYDREFALVDTSGTALRLQTCPKLGLISPVVDPESQKMTVSAPGCKDLVVNLSESLYHGGDNVVQVCGNKCGGRLWGDAEVSEWFSSFLGIQCWLARYSSSTTEIYSPCNSKGVLRSGFSNEQPILLVSENAVAALNNVLVDQLQRPVDSKRFRPNLVVKAVGDENDSQHHQYRHIEDDWKTLSLANKDLSFKVEGGCPRCTMVDYDPATGQKGKTLRALAKYRRRNGSIVFGIFLQAIKYRKDNHEDIWIEEGDILDCNL